MNQSRLLVTFLFALVVALGASYLVYRQISRTTSAAAQGTLVVSAVRNLDVGSRIGETDIEVMRWPGPPPAGTIGDAETVIGRALIYPIFAGELLLESKLAAEGSGGGLAPVISEGMRAVSIRVDEVVAVAGYVVAGTRVDVLFTGTPGGVGRDEALTQTILEDVQVLAAGQKIQPDADGTPQRVNVVTLLCTPENAAKVVLAASEGRIQLVLRNPTDRALQEAPNSVKRDELYAGTNPPSPPARPRPRPVAPPSAPEPPAPTTAPLEFIRGTTVNQLEVPLGE